MVRPGRFLPIIFTYLQLIMQSTLPTRPVGNYAKREESPLREDTPIETFPEGGPHAWRTVAGAWCGVAASAGARSSLGLYQTYLLGHQLKDCSPSTVAWIFSFFAFNSFFWGIFAGPAFDAYGPRWLLLAGSFLLCAAFFLVGICSQFWHCMFPPIQLEYHAHRSVFLAIGLLGGIGACALQTTCYATISQFFSRKRAFASGIVGTGGSCGGIAFILAVQQLLPQVGFNWSSRYMAFIVLFCMLVLPYYNGTCQR